MNRDALARRYRYLWTGEAAAIVVFIVLFLNAAPPRGHWSGWIARTYGLGVLVGILVQGIVWWRLKLRLLRRRERLSPRTVDRFRLCKWVNWFLVGGFPLVLAAKASGVESLWADGDTWWGIALAAAALLEQINYYHHQLMYDSRRDRAHLRARRRLRRGNIGAVLARPATGDRSESRRPARAAPRRPSPPARHPPSSGDASSSGGTSSGAGKKP